MIKNGFYSNLIINYDDKCKKDIFEEKNSLISSKNYEKQEKNNILQYNIINATEKYSQNYSNDQFNNSNFDFNSNKTMTLQIENRSSFLINTACNENISVNVTTSSRLDTVESAVTSAKGPTTKKCKVCSDKAVNQNFGVLSCESCKAFFRRNAIRSSPLKCSNGTDVCNVTSSTRKQCPSCRLKKCLFVGMRSELIQIRKNNPKVNSNKRKANTISHDTNQQKCLLNRNSNESNSSGRLSQDNVEENLYKMPSSINTNVDSNVNNQSFNSANVSSTLWLDKSQVNNHSNVWISMNNVDNYASFKKEDISKNYINNFNNQSMNDVNSVSQNFDPIKYDLKIPMIKIKTSQNILQPIALLPAVKGSIYTTANLPPLYSNHLDTNISECANNTILSKEKSSNKLSKTFYQTNSLNYSFPDTNSRSFDSSHSSAFYPFSIQSSNSSPPTLFYNCLDNQDIKSPYFWNCCTMPTSDSSINTDHNSFISIDSGSDHLYSNNTYPNSCSSSQKYFLTPDKCEGSDNNPYFIGVDGNEDIQDSDLTDIVINNDINSLFNSVHELPFMSFDSSNSKEHEFILKIGVIWEKTFGKMITISNSIVIQNNKNFKNFKNKNNNESINSKTNFSSEVNWKLDFIKLSETFSLQLQSFLTQVIQIINWEDNIMETMKHELKNQLESNSKSSMLVLLPVVFSSFIYSFDDGDDNVNLDREVENYLFQDTSHVFNSESCENVIANFSVEKFVENKNAFSSQIIRSQLDLSILSNRLLALNHINYSSLQYLDKYCSGLYNFLSPSPVLYGLFCLIKVISMQHNVDYSNINWNNSLLNKVSSPLSKNEDKITKLIYYLKSIFLTACDIIQIDTVEQRLQSLDQFLSWGTSQFDVQWINFFNDNIQD